MQRRGPRPIDDGDEMAGSAIDELSTSLGDINATLRALKERMAEAANDQRLREDRLYRDLADIKAEQRGSEKMLSSLEQKIGGIERQLTELYQPEPVSQKVMRLETEIASLNRERYRLAGVALVISIFAGAVSNWLVQFFFSGWIHNVAK
jgi:chromosome segregation ATPase